MFTRNVTVTRAHVRIVAGQRVNVTFRRGREPGPSDDPTAGKPLARSGAAEVSRDRLPPVPFAPLEKLPAIGAFVRARPLAWIDDVISEEAQHWAAQRGSPTLIVEVDPAIGLTSDIVKRLEERATTSLGKVTG